MVLIKVKNRYKELKMILPNTADYSKCKNEQEFKMLFLKSAPKKRLLYVLY